MTELAADWIRHFEPYFVNYGAYLVFLFLFLKGIIFLSPFMPGATALVIAGGLARQGKVSLLLLGLAGTVGTAGGDVISYFIGQRVSERLRQSKRWGKHIAAVQDRIRKEPALIVVCHFETILRTLVPAVAGMSGIPFRRWLLLNTLGSALWVTAYMAAGYFLSRSGAVLLSKTVALVVIGLLIVIFGGRYLLRRFGRRRAMAEGDGSNT